MPNGIKKVRRFDGANTSLWKIRENQGTKVTKPGMSVKSLKEERGGDRLRKSLHYLLFPLQRFRFTLI